MPRIPVHFDGVSRGARTAAAETRHAIKGVGDQADTETRRVSRFGSSIRSSLSIAARVGAGGLLALGGAVGFVGFRFNALRQSSELAFETMLGSGTKARSFLNDLQKFAARTPFEFPELIRSSQRLLAMGFAAKDVLPTLTAVGNATAAMGGDPQVMEATIRAIGQVQAKGRLMAEEMMQLNEAGTFSWRALASEIGTSVPKAMELVQKGAVTSDIFMEAFTRNTERRFGNMMERQSHTFNGLLSTLRDTFSQVAGRVLRPFFDDATRGMQSLVDATSRPDFERNVERFARSLRVNLVGAARTTVTFFRRNWPEIKDTLSDAADAAVDMFRAGRRVAEVADKIADAMGGWDDAFSLIVSGMLARKVVELRRGFTLLAGTEAAAGAAATGTGIAGATAGSGALLRNLRALSSIGLITIGIELLVNKEQRDKIARFGDQPWINDLADKLGVDPGWLPILGLFAPERTSAHPGGGPPGQTTSSNATNQPGSMTRKQRGVVQTAATQLGQPYRFGGPAILFHPTDCSGFVQAVMRKNGITVPRTTYEQWRSGRPVSVKNLQPGDLVFFHMGARGPEHVGIYIGNDTFIEDPHTGASVRYSTFSTRGGYVGARRVIGGGNEAATAGEPGDVSDTPIDVGPGTGKPTTKKAKEGPEKADPLERRRATAGVSAVIARIGQLVPRLRERFRDQARDLLEDTAKAITDEQMGKVTSRVERFKEKFAKALELTREIRTTRRDARALAEAIGRMPEAAEPGLRARMANLQRLLQTATNKAQLDRIKTQLEQIREVWRAAVERMEADVERRRDAFARAFGALADKALAVFDAKTERLLAAAVAKSDDLDSRLKAQTPAERALAAFRRQRDAERRAQARTDAEALEDPVERAARLRELDLEDQEDALQAAADAERAAVEEEVRIERERREKVAEEQRKQIEGDRAIQRERFVARLDEIRRGFDDESLTATQAQDALMDLLRAYEIPMEDIGALLGGAFAASFTSAIDDVSNAIRDLTEAINTLRKATGQAPLPVPGGGGGGRPHGPIAVPGEGYQHGGRVPGRFVGRYDTVAARLTAGEEVIDRSLSEALRRELLSGPRMRSSGSVPVFVLGATEREVGRALERLVTPERDRRIGYSQTR